MDRGRRRHRSGGVGHLVGDDHGCEHGMVMAARAWDGQSRGGGGVPCVGVPWVGHRGGVAAGGGADLRGARSLALAMSSRWGLGAALGGPREMTGGASNARPFSKEFTFQFHDTSLCRDGDGEESCAADAQHTASQSRKNAPSRATGDPAAPRGLGALARPGRRHGGAEGLLRRRALPRAAAAEPPRRRRRRVLGSPPHGRGSRRDPVVRPRVRPRRARVGRGWPREPHPRSKASDSNRIRSCCEE